MLGAESGFRLEFEGEIEAAVEAGLVYYETLQPAHSRECVCEHSNSDVARSAFGLSGALTDAGDRQGIRRMSATERTVSRYLNVGAKISVAFSSHCMFGPLSRE